MLQTGIGSGLVGKENVLILWITILITSVMTHIFIAQIRWFWLTLNTIYIIYIYYELI